MRRFIIYILCLFVVSAACHAAVPKRISYQGKITQSTGIPCNGSMSMTFRIYDSPTGGNLLWGPETQAIEANNGLFTAYLGETVPLTTDVFTTENAYLETEVAGQTLTPRPRIVSTAYALVSEQVSTITPANVADILRLMQSLPDADGDGYTKVSAGGTDCDDSNPSIHPGATEVCNGKDDDCNGQIDDGLPSQGPCSAGVGACMRSGQITCSNGVWQCNVEPGEPNMEVCNGLDDDCDGLVDEELSNLGSCTVGIGACMRQGQYQCVSGAVQCSAVPGQPSQEVCNGLDDDCDGSVDEGLGSQGPCEAGYGRCLRAGQITCVDGVFQCDAVPADPEPEVCNGLDDDCDGQVDEGMGDMGPCTTGLPGVCSQGHMVCADGAITCVQAVVPSAEVCNGLDDDCDGQIDEGLGSQGPCIVGIGACMRSGQITCVDGAVGCNVVPGQPSQEVCNGLDDDCDGEIDEGINGLGACPIGLPGVCSQGNLFCVSGAIQCVQAVQPSPEICNRLDDDCDGAVDEGLSDMGPCATGLPGVCSQGHMVCVSGAIQCIQAVQPTAEVCNGLDDDCDGVVDEGC